MYPVLFHLGEFAVRSYAFMLALAFLSGMYFTAWRAKQRNLQQSVVYDAGFYIVLSGMFGARLMYVLQHLPEFQDNISSIFNPFVGSTVGIEGFSLFGGAAGAFGAALLFFRLKKIPILPYADAAAPSSGLIIFFMKTGCFLNGCCYGVPVQGNLGVSFPETSPAGQYQLYIQASQLFPVQLLHAFAGILLFIASLVAGRKTVFTGFELYLAGLLYSLMRFFLDFFREYPVQNQFVSLSYNQLVCILLFVLFTALLSHGAYRLRQIASTNLVKE